MIQGIWQRQGRRTWTFSWCKKSTLTLCMQIDNHYILWSLMIRSLVNGWDFCIVWFLFTLLLNIWSTGWCLSYFLNCCWYRVSNNTLTPTRVCFIFDCNCHQIVIGAIFTAYIATFKVTWSTTPIIMQNFTLTNLVLNFPFQFI